MKDWLTTAAVGALFALVSACSMMGDESDNTSTAAAPMYGGSSTGESMAGMAPAAGPGAGATMGEQAMAPESDAMFAQDAARSDSAEIRMARMALQRATNPQVRQFAQRMIDDHLQSTAKLMAISQSGGVTLASAPGPTGQSVIQQLSTMQGASFDRAYMRVQVQAHQQVEALLQSEIQNGKDPRLQAFARQALPVVQSHLQEAQQIASTL
ncbi:MAG: DUF4142 domain-containing protein [Rhodospirillaceae bacterium]|nr:DUF4142 domain-containing protein [Rhodospirillaceae bacterium]